MTSSLAYNLSKTKLASRGGHCADRMYRLISVFKAYAIYYYLPVPVT